jgi:hypothetical protein
MATHRVRPLVQPTPPAGEQYLKIIALAPARARRSFQRCLHFVRRITPNPKISMKTWKALQSCVRVSRAVALFMLMMATHAYADRNYYVDAVNGADNNDGLSTAAAFKSMTRARDVVRGYISNGMSENIIVNLRGTGAFVFSTALEFTEADSGSNGFNIYWQSYSNETAVISGGAQVTDWEPHGDPANNIWKASMTKTNDVRWMNVNGVRRSRAYSVIKKTGIGWNYDACGHKDGIIVPDSVIGYWGNASDMEVRWDYEWRSHRLPVASIVPGSTGTKVIRFAPIPLGWSQSMGAAPLMPSYDQPFVLHNAYELLGEATGVCYYDELAQILYYHLAAGENLAAGNVVVPVLDGPFITITGSSPSLANRVRNLTFKGITFRYNRLSRASALGSLPGQANKWANEDDMKGASENQGYLPRAAIEVTNADNVNFERNTLTRLGGIGLALISGVSNSAIIRNNFIDISDSALTAGTWRLFKIDAGEGRVESITVKNNTVDGAGAEFFSAPGMAFYYVQSCVISHNHLQNLPYSGISLGWGWNTPNGTNKTALNDVTNNHIENYMNVVSDGAGIYTLGPRASPVNNESQGDLIDSNYVDVQTPAKSDGYTAFYADQGSSYLIFTNNVAKTPTTILHGWLQLAYDGTLSNFTASDNYSTLSTVWSKAIYDTCSVTDDVSNATKKVYVSRTTVSPTATWPTAAQDIINKAGLEPSN